MTSPKYSLLLVLSGCVATVGACPATTPCQDEFIVESLFSGKGNGADGVRRYPHDAGVTLFVVITHNSTDKLEAQLHEPLGNGQFPGARPPPPVARCLTESNGSTAAPGSALQRARRCRCSTAKPARVNQSRCASRICAGSKMAPTRATTSSPSKRRSRCCESETRTPTLVKRARGNAAVTARSLTTSATARARRRG